MPLRSYQQEALANSKRKFDQGITRQLIALPTGTGKTVVFANLLRHHGIEKKLLVLVHRRELAEQAFKKLRAANPGIKIGTEMGQDEAWRADQIVIAGVQTIGTTNGAARLRRFDPNEFGAIVCDEAHHAIASTYMRVFDHFCLFAEDNKKLLLGVTATPVRSDGRGLNGAFQEIVHKMSILEAITQGWLCDLKAYRIRTNIDLDAVRAYRDGDFVESELGTAINTPLRNSRIVRNWLELGENRKTVVFCVTVQHARDLAAAFKSEGVNADCVWGEDPERAAKLDRHKRGDLTVLTSCGVLTEGYDDWQISCILLARPTKSELLFTQMIGRGTRIEEGIGNMVEARDQGRPTVKPDCIVIDVVDNSRTHRLVNMATLFGYEADHDFRGARVSRVAREVRDNAPTEPKLAPEMAMNEMTALIEEVDLFAPTWSSGLLNRSVLQWFRRGNSFLLPLPDRDQISIQHRGAWTTSVVRQGRTFVSPPFTSFADAFAFGENEFTSHWIPLIHQLEREEHSLADSMTPIQKQLLCAAEGLEANLYLTRDQAAHRIATTYERELNARCVSQLPPEEESLLDTDQISHPGPIEIEPQAKSCTLPEPWNPNGSKGSVLQWYRTDDGGYAMPLPDMGELFLVPRDSRWRLSGEISGVKVDEQFCPSIETAFAAAKVEMERVGTEVLSAISAEQNWLGNEPTPLQRSLLRNLFDRRTADQVVDDRASAQRLIESRYIYEFNPASGGKARSTDGYTTQIMERYRIDRDGIYESLESGE